MEMKTGLLVIGVCVVVLTCAPSTRAVTITSGINFQHPVNRTQLFDRFTLDSADPIILRPSLVSQPSLPGWLNFVQITDNSDGYLYGTPEDSNIGEYKLEVIGLNSRTYKSSRILLPLTVVENTEPPSFLASFFIINHNLDDFLLSAELRKDFRAAVNSVWGQGSEVIIHSLTSAQDLGLRVPIVPDPDDKYGVQVTVGGQEESESLAAIISEASGPCQQGEDYTPSNISGFFLTLFTIDWCSVSMTPVDTTQPPVMNKSSVFLGGMYDPPVLPVEDSDRFLEFLLLVVVPCAIMACSILVLGYLMCCGRRGRKELAHSSELQLTHHRTLRHACRDLRTMSNRRDGTASVATLTPIGTPTVGSQRSHSRSRGYDEYPWTSTPQVNHRGMATPPPYRTPPHPHKHRETSFSNQDKRRLSEPSNARAEELASMRPAPPFMGSSTSDRGVRPRHV